MFWFDPNNYNLNSSYDPDWIYFKYYDDTDMYYSQEVKIMYEGEFESGKKSGKGIIFYYENGDRYEGEWKYDERNGNGKYYYTDGSGYIDEIWSNDKPSGCKMT